MIELATVTAIISAVTSAVGLIDKVTDSYFKFRDRGSGVPKEHRAKITSSEDGKDLVRLEDGREVQCISHKDLMDRLSESDLTYIQALEKSMNSRKKIWESVYPKLANETNPVTEAKIRNQLEDVTKEMESDLTKILGFVEKTGLYLDDHYMAIRDIAEHH